MKITFAAAIITAVFLGLMAGSASAGDPLPGIDVKIGKNPGGAIVAKTTTNKAGKFVFDNLAAGQYVLSVDAPQPQTRGLINTTRSNIRHGGISMVNGVQVVTASVLLGADRASEEIEITAAKGTIAGTVTRAPAPKGSGAK
jgi:hypothetical protein